MVEAAYRQACPTLRNTTLPADLHTAVQAATAEAGFTLSTERFCARGTGVQRRKVAVVLLCRYVVNTAYTSIKPPRVLGKEIVGVAHAHMV